MKKQMVLVLALVLTLCLLFGASGCAEDESSDSGVATIEPGKWYSTALLDGLSFRNCVITDAFPRANGGGVFATYIPVCQGCHEQGVICNAILDSENPYQTTSICDCGIRTIVDIQYM